MAAWPYNTPQWKRLRLAHLSRFPLCIGCEARGILKPANTVDHRTAISDGGAPFPGHDGLASYCPSCHSRKTARGPEAGAFRSTTGECDVNGRPLSRLHPWNGGTGKLTADYAERRLPTDLAPSAIPLAIVCGPPGSGKSTHVRQHAGPGDVIVCLDTIMQEMTGLPEHHTPKGVLQRALDERNRRLRALATDDQNERAWFIVQAPAPADRRAWRDRLRGELIVIDTPLPECIRRINADATRPPEHKGRMVEAAKAWWRANPHLVRRWPKDGAAKV